MNLVVFNDAGNEGEQARGEEESPMAQHARPLHKE